MPLPTALGGIVQVSSAIMRREQWGSGIPQVKAAYALQAGRISMRDAIGKFILGILQVGSGASLGREGPTVQICAGISSWLAQLASLSRQNQRRMAAVAWPRIAAAFNAPIASVTFTLEEIIGDLDQTMLSGVIVAAAIAAAVERSILGQHPVFDIQRAYNMGPASSLLSYVVLGVGPRLFPSSSRIRCSASRLVQAVYRGAEVGTPGHRRRADRNAGGHCIVVAETDGITGGGYGTLSLALTGSFTVKVLLGLCVLKLAATVFSYSSGGVGGIFAPSLSSVECSAERWAILTLRYFTIRRT